MWETKSSVKQDFKIRFELNFNTIPDDYEKNSLWMCEKNFNFENGKTELLMIPVS